MQIINNSFPKLQFIYLFLSFFVIYCSEKSPYIIDKEQFIEIYTRLLIIQEMEISKEYHDRLITELLDQYDITREAIDSTVVHLAKNPTEYEYVLEQVRKNLQDLSNEMKIVPEKVIEPEKKRSILSRKLPQIQKKEQEEGILPERQQRQKKEEDLLRERQKKKRELKKVQPEK